MNAFILMIISIYINLYSSRSTKTHAICSHSDNSPVKKQENLSHFQREKLGEGVRVKEEELAMSPCPPLPRPLFLAQPPLYCECHQNIKLSKTVFLSQGRDTWRFCFKHLKSPLQNNIHSIYWKISSPHTAFLKNCHF